jgi:sulfite reductase (NADPH) flavoprotein alpha-component
MSRRFHALAGLAFGLFVTFMALTGAVLSVQPALETLAAHSPLGGETVAALADKVTAALPGVDRIVRSASGQVVAYYLADGKHQAAIVDPASGAVVGPYQPSAFFSFFTELHRSLFFGDAGRAVAGVAALVMLALAVSGMLLLIRRLGGIRQLFARGRGTFPQRFHADLARFAVVVLALTALSGGYMSARTFGFVPDGQSDIFALPVSGSGGAAAPVATLSGLRAAHVADLRELDLPAADDTAGVFTLKTHQGENAIDPATGAVLSTTPVRGWAAVYEMVYMLHTGQGLWWLGLILGLGALSVPVLAVTGLWIYAVRQGQRPRFGANVSATGADLVVLVGSEGQTTWGFATAFAEAATAAGRKVHLGAMTDVRRSYPRAGLMVVMTATYGDGDAPASASRFLDRLRKWGKAPVAAVAILGFGDRSFPQYCAYADQVADRLSALGATPAVPYFTIDRQSPQRFADWGRTLAPALGVPLALVHTPKHPKTQTLELVERLDYGVDVQAPTSILSFKAAAGSLKGFEVGDLIGILPPGHGAPRYYSLASRAADGVVEIAVRKQAGGLCSVYLTALKPGDRIEGFFRPNTDFRPQPSSKPLILIGAGTGIAPLAGLVRHNRRKRPMHVFFGGRDPQSDFLYRSDFDAAYQSGRLASLTTAFSRVGKGGYVQDRVSASADSLRAMIEDGASIVVCGGLDMAKGVREALEAVIVPLGIDLDSLKRSGRYLEDAY